MRAATWAGYATGALLIGVLVSPLLYLAAVVFVWLPMLDVLAVTAVAAVVMAQVQAVRVWGLVGTFERLKDALRRVIEGPGQRPGLHNAYDFRCDRYVGHNGVPKGVDIYEERCVLCDPFTEEEADALLRKDV